MMWSELVSFGIDFGWHEVVKEALGVDVVDVIPELLRLVELEVRSGEPVSAVLARELRDLRR